MDRQENNMKDTSIKEKISTKENNMKDAGIKEEISTKEKKIRDTDKGRNKAIRVYELERNKDVVKESQPAYMQKRYTIEDYYALQEDMRAELINGIFYEMLAPSTIHQDIVMELGYLFRDFIKKEKGKCKVYVAPLDVQLDCDMYTMVQPDLMVVCDRNKNAGRCIMGAPDLIIEVLSPSTKKKDMGIKLYKYKDAGVREYWLADPKEEKITVYEFEKGSGSKVYTADEEVPVGIYDGKLKIRFQNILDECWEENS